MNKNVLHYLQDKKTQLANLTKDQVNHIQEFLAKNGGQIKRSATGIFLAALTALAALPMTGCNNVNGPHENTSSTAISGPADQSEHNPFQVLEIRDLEEIKEKGIKAEDVLALYDNLALTLEHSQYPKSSVNESLWEAYDATTAEFESFTVRKFDKISFGHNGEEVEIFDYPFFIESLTYSPSCHWSPIKEDPLSDVFVGIFNYNIVLDNTYYNRQNRNFGIYDKEFGKTMDAFKIPASTLSKDKQAFADIDDYFEPLVGQTIYGPLVIDRNLILNANEEQLWALYNMFNSMYSINIEGTLPNNQKSENELTE